MKNLISVLLGMFTLVMPALAFAHHPLGGVPMETFFHGLLSGIGHPILGFDHLFFVMIVGVAAIYSGWRHSSALIYVAAMLVGCMMMSSGVNLPIKEVIIGASLLILGVVILSGKELTFPPILLLFAVFGLFHGSAFGDSLVAQESGINGSIISGYLLGLVAIQYSIAIFSGWILFSVFNAQDSGSVEPRIAGAMVAGVGLFLTLENIEGYVFEVLNLTS